MDIKLQGDKVLIKVDAKEEVTPGGIYLPDVTITKDDQIIGTVIAVGSGLRSNGKVIPLSVKAGDRVIFPAWAGQEVEVDNTKYLFVKEVSLLAIIEEE